MVSIDTVARFERGDELKERTIDALQRARASTWLQAKVVRRKTGKASEKKRLVPRRV